MRWQALDLSSVLSFWKDPRVTLSTDADVKEHSTYQKISAASDLGKRRDNIVILQDMAL